MAELSHQISITRTQGCGDIVQLYWSDWSTPRRGRPAFPAEKVLARADGRPYSISARANNTDALTLPSSEGQASCLGG